MIPIASTLLPGISQTGSAAPTSALPWPNSSLISAQVISMDTPDLATIMLGAYRMQAKVPPNTPLGHIWLELMNREIPAQMRILSEARVLELLVQKIAHKMQAQNTEKANLSGKPAAQAATLSQMENTGWPMPNAMQLPFTAHISADQQRMFLEQNDDGSPRGMIEKKSDDNHYALHGRLDLDHLGTLFFMLEQKSEQPMQIKLKADSHQAFMALQQPFDAFLTRQSKDQSSDGSSPLQGRLYEGRDPFIKPTHKQGTLA